MSARPEDWPRLFTERLDAGDLDAVMALYDADARFVSPSGETIVGRERIRPELARLIDAGTRLESRVIRAVPAGDVALLSTPTSRAAGSQSRGRRPRSATTRS